ncbi:MAG: MmcQ/YjbR family DNA-binding protein [Candidatus Dormiibacterota bacterium]
MSSIDDIRRWALALPEVAETSHHLFHEPVFKVRGRSFLGIGAGGSTAVFCISEQDANEAAAADPATCEAVRRRDARRSFLGLQVQLASVPDSRIRRLVEDAWRRQAPKRLVAERDRSGSASP